MTPADSTEPLVLPALIFPSFETKISTRDGVVRMYDDVRKQQVALTPEEWVRQHCIHWLVNHKHYPIGRCSVERVVRGTLQRYDIVWMDEHMKPFLLVECKAPSIAITEETLRQSAWYNLTLRAPTIILTNGRSAVVAAIDDDGSMRRLDDVPPYPEATR